MARDAEKRAATGEKKKGKKQKKKRARKEVSFDIINLEKHIDRRLYSENHYRHRSS